jgi:hypothetical protein
MESAYDPETVTLLRAILDDTWSSMPPQAQALMTKSDLAQRILKQAAKGERDPVRLRAAALLSVVADGSHSSGVR